MDDSDRANWARDVEEGRADKADRWEHKPLSPEPQDTQRRRKALVEDEDRGVEFPEGTVMYVKGLSQSTGRRALRELADRVVQGAGKVEYVDLEKGLDAVGSGVGIA
jgi:hypothetical protein